MKRKCLKTQTNPKLRRVTELCNKYLKNVQTIFILLLLSLHYIINCYLLDNHYILVNLRWNCTYCFSCKIQCSESSGVWRIWMANQPSIRASLSPYRGFIHYRYKLKCFHSLKKEIDTFFICFKCLIQNAFRYIHDKSWYYLVKIRVYSQSCC